MTVRVSRSQPSKRLSAKEATFGYRATSSSDPPRISPRLQYAPIRQWRLYKTAHLLEKAPAPMNETAHYCSKCSRRTEDFGQSKPSLYSFLTYVKIYCLVRDSAPPDVLTGANLGVP